MLTKVVIGLKFLIAAGTLAYVVAHWADLSDAPTVGDLKDIGVVGLVFGVPPVFALVRAAFIEIGLVERPDEPVDLYLKTMGISGPEETEAFLEEIQRRDRETDAKFYEAIGRIRAQVRPA